MSYLFDVQAEEQPWPEWFTPSRTQPTCARNVAKGLHPTGAALGPQDQQCGTCRHAVKRVRYPNAWWKCAKGRMSRCAASDIRLKWRACAMWEGD